MTDQPQAEPADQPTTSYSPPSESRPPWPSTPAWPQQTPERWFEPMPGEDRRRSGGRRQGQAPWLLATFAVALLAGIIGSIGTVLWLDSTGRLGAPLTGGLAASPSVLSSPAPAASSTPTPTPTPVNDGTVVSRAAEAVSPAVVTIATGAGDATDLLELPPTGVGSGIIFDAAGWILTNRHVVADATQVRVELQDGRVLIGTVYGEDTLTDLAIVRIEDDELPVAIIGDSSQLRPGELAVAIGSPLGTFTNSVTSGVISALGRDVQVNDPVTGQARWLRNLIQTDAAINPGNSGGALVDEAGTVVGINTAVASDAQGIGFAIPINIAKPLLRQAIAGEPLARPWIGISYMRVDRNVADERDLPIDYGVLISSDTNRPAVQPDSPAEEAGLEAGDIITAINGQRIDAAHNLDDVLSEYQPGDRLTLMVLRSGTTRQLFLTLGVRPADLF
jgi:S1-C subfamily serine protease